VSEFSSGLVLDVRGVTPAHRRPLIFSIIDKMLQMDCTDSIVVICDAEPAGLGYQLELRRETKGLFEFDYDKRLDGAWVGLIRRRPGT
jgi:uncharacterized protein (DUF2249 family)